MIYDNIINIDNISHYEEFKMKRVTTSKLGNESKYTIFVLTIELLISFVQVIPMIPHSA